MGFPTRRASLVLALTLVASPVFGQQVFESVGERALGMGGAFVAVADDATAVHWNPAGLVTGQPVGMTIGVYRSQTGNRQAAPYPGPAADANTFTSLGTWPLGVSWGRFSSTSLGPDASGALAVRTLRTSQLGVTILQSLTERLVIGSTLKYLRGSAAAAAPAGATVAAVLDEADRLASRARGTFDLDVGLMADLDRVRLGLTWKNLRSPRFGDRAVFDTSLRRHARMGVALLPSDGVTLAMDIDLDTVDLRGGLRRMIAVGGETRLGRRLALRSGVRWSLVGARRPVGAVGASLSLRAGLWLDGHLARGRFDEDRELGAALRAGF